MKIKSYEECVSFLFSLERAGIKYDLKNITKLLEFLGNPHKSFRSIHIAGTNGKGSVAAILNSILLEAGFRTGFFSSPHLIDVRERFLVNGRYISKKFILNFTNKIYNEIKKNQPSFFEVTTAMAFEYFKYKKVDYAVIETGLGGRLDSTNILDPVVSVITALGIEHTEYLGETIEEITKEKAGIIKNKKPVLVGEVPAASKRIIKKISLGRSAPLYFTDEAAEGKINERKISGITFSYSDKSRRFKKAAFPMLGDFQMKNLKTSLLAVSVFENAERIKIINKVIRRGLLNIKNNSRLHGRFELISTRPLIVVDVSHNEQGIQNLKKNLSYLTYEKLFIIFGMMEDKDYRKCIEIVERLNGKIIITKAGIKRSADPYLIFGAVKNKNKAVIVKNVRDSWKLAKSEMTDKDLLLVTGSFFVAGDFLKLFDSSVKDNKLV